MSYISQWHIVNLLYFQKVQAAEGLFSLSIFFKEPVSFTSTPSGHPEKPSPLNSNESIYTHVNESCR